MKPRSLEELFAIALERHDLACRLVDQADRTGGANVEFVAHLQRAARGTERRWRRVLTHLARVLLRRLPHQEGGGELQYDWIWRRWVPVTRRTVCDE